MKLHNNITEVIFVTFLLFIFTSAVEYSEINEGYAQGFIPRCPNLTKPAEIKPEHLDNLKIEVLSNGSLLEAKWTSYNYHNVKALAMNSDVDFRQKTVVYAPGYFEPTALPLGRNLMVIYKKLGYNVLLLEYVTFTTNIYPVVVRLSRSIGNHVGEMLAELSTVGLDPEKLELVGLSLGGVIMPFIARRFRQITGRNISSITALDPSGPCVRHLGPDQRLDISDADLVLHIATNTGGYGMTTPVGHVTVYVNGGEYQPGFLTSFLCDDLCSHWRSLLIWMSALEHPGSFIAMQCDSVQQAKDHLCFNRKPRVTNTLDLYTDRRKPGIYYLATSHNYPYYLGTKGLKRIGAEVLNQISELNAVDVLRV